MAVHVSQVRRSRRCSGYRRRSERRRGRLSSRTSRAQRRLRRRRRLNRRLQPRPAHRMIVRGGRAEVLSGWLSLTHSLAHAFLIWQLTRSHLPRMATHSRRRRQRRRRRRRRRRRGRRQRRTQRRMPPRRKRSRRRWLSRRRRQSRPGPAARALSTPHHYQLYPIHWAVICYAQCP